MIVVDSSVWIDYFNGVKSWQTDTLDDVLGHQRIVVGDLILAEVLQGFKQDKDYHVAKFLLESLEFQAMLGKQIAIQSADNYRLLRRQGITVRKTIDVIIGTFCIANDFALLHDDKDFDGLEKLGLKVIRGIA
jgi:predicted nucleic acid-binding protein